MKKELLIAFASLLIGFGPLLGLVWLSGYDFFPLHRGVPLRVTVLLGTISSIVSYTCPWWRG